MRVHYSVSLTIQTYTEPVPSKYGKLAKKYPWIYGYFYSAAAAAAAAAAIGRKLHLSSGISGANSTCHGRARRRTKDVLVRWNEHTRDETGRRVDDADNNEILTNRLHADLAQQTGRMAASSSSSSLSSSPFHHRSVLDPPTAWYRCPVGSETLGLVSLM